MRLCLLFSALLLSACFRNEPTVTPAPTVVPADLLRPCAGWTGPVPRTEGELTDALVAEVGGRRCANGRILAVAEILG